MKNPSVIKPNPKINMTPFIINSKISQMQTLLNLLFQNVNQKIVNRIQIVKHNFFEEYQEQMKIMMKQLADIKARLDQANMKERANEKLFLLEEQRDYFRHKVSKLDSDVRKVQAQNKKLKNSYKEAQQQISNYKKICFQLEKSINKMKEETIQIYRSKYDELLQKEIKATYSKNQQDIKQTQRSQFLKTNRIKSSSTKILKTNTEKRILTHTKVIEKKSEETQQTIKILSDCIKQMKKQIFYRNLKTDELEKKYFQEDKMIQFDKFSKSDKKELLYRMMSNPTILEKFYNFILKNSDIPLEKASNNATFSAIKPFDEKYNRESLTNMKKKFDQRLQLAKSKTTNTYQIFANIK